MPRRNSARLTKRLLDSLTPEPDRDFAIWDGELSGFGVRVKPSGAKSFQIKYRAANGAQRKKSIGRYGALTVDMARKLALAELGKVAQGEDPVGETQARKRQLTVAELCDRYYEDAEAGRVLYRNRPKKASTLAVDKGRIDCHIKPLLGDVQVHELTRKQIERFMFDVRDGKTATDRKTGYRRRSIVKGGPNVAAKSVLLLSAMYRYAIRMDLASENPCRDIEKPPDGKRTRFITEQEYAALGAAMNAPAHVQYAPAIRAATLALLLTGTRRSEILNLRWREVDADGNCFRFLDTKTGPQVRPCGNLAIDYLTGLPRDDDEWVFKSETHEGPIREIRQYVAWLMKESDITGVSPHVFRHSFATVAFELGYSELIIAGLLGHRLSSVTSRYAHKVDHVLVKAADHVSRTIAKRLGLALANRHSPEPATIKSKTVPPCLIA